MVSLLIERKPLVKLNARLWTLRDVIPRCTHTKKKRRKKKRERIIGTSEKLNS